MRHAYHHAFAMNSTDQQWPDFLVSFSSKSLIIPAFICNWIQVILVAKSIPGSCYSLKYLCSVISGLYNYHTQIATF